MNSNRRSFIKGFGDQAAATAFGGCGSNIFGFNCGCRRLIGSVLLAGILADTAVAAAGLADTLETKSLQARIDELAAKGGGTLVLTNGTYRSGALFFRPGVNLHLEEGALLVGADGREDYPVRRTRLGGKTLDYYPALINADRCDGFRITGKGVIDGHGLNVWKEYRRRQREGTIKHDVTLDMVRPRLVYVSNSRDVDLSGVTFRDSKFWTIHFYRCQDVVVRDCTILARVLDGVFGPSTDAIDLDVVTNAVVRGVYMNVNDDGVVMKGGRGAWADDPVRCPDQGGNKNILVENCTFGRHCHACFTCGSECLETDGAVIRNCKVENSGNLLWLKMRPDTHQRYHGIVISNCTGTVQNGVRIFRWTQYFDLEGRTDLPRSEVYDITVDCPDLTTPCPMNDDGGDYYSVRNLRVDLRTPSRKRSLDFVDPLIGTEGAGTQYGGMMPYTGVPFGSFHAVPMTRTNRIGRLSFNSADKDLLGVILTRQPAIWMGDWGEVRVAVSPAKISALDSTPYLTRVTAGGRTYEFTATAHAAWIRGLDDDTVAAFPETGVNTNRMDAKYGYPLPNFGGHWHADKSRPGELKIGLSLLSADQAKANLVREIGTRTFEAVVAETKAAWEALFARVDIEAPDDVKTIFYTGLLHTLLYPRQIDEDGRYYSAMDDKIHTGTAYTCYSLWDTYRAEHPWLTLIAPERVDGLMQSLVDMYREGGWLPKWPNPSYTGIMVGAPAEVVLAEAYVKGFRGFDLAGAYEAVRKNATVPQQGDESRSWCDRGEFGRTPETRAGLTSYMKRGYVACDKTLESVSRTQDFGQADLAAAILADATGHAEDARMFRARSRNYTNLWNAAAKEFHPRRSDGSFGAASNKWNYCEQSAHTAVWAVPYDTEKLAELLGGNEEATRRLDDFFDRLFWVPERGNKSIHGNEPSHHCAYLYNRFGHPEKTQRRVREILTRSYSTNRKGFDGNEDCGQMSAWYVLSALGFYPLDPASGEYELGSPLVRSATLRFGAPYAPATLRISVRNYAPGRWRVRRVMLNGRALSDWRVKHADLVKGGELCFEMTVD